MTLTYMYPYKDCNSRVHINNNTVKLGNKERFDKEQIGVKEPFLETNLPIYFIRIRNNFRVIKKFLVTWFDCTCL